MFEIKNISKLDDYFCKLSSRVQKGVYFYRLCGYSVGIKSFIKKYYQVARGNGVVIEGKIANPDEKNLAYYFEIMGMQFQSDRSFINQSLKKWLPRMSDFARENVADALCTSLDELKRSGKNENMLKNAYIKFMCWMYYKFERIANKLGTDDVPKILYEGIISNYELILISVLARAGCDVLLLQYEGDQNYLELDPNSEKSMLYNMEQMTPFPEGFCLKQIIQEIQSDMNRERLYGQKPQICNCTNAWISGKGFEDFCKGFQARGEHNNKFYYNCFYRINGVEDKLIYENQLHQFYLELKNLGRKIVVIDGEISKPTTEEISAVNRKNYVKQEEALLDLAKNIDFSQNKVIQQLMIKAFIDTLLEEQSSEQILNINKLVNQAVYLICWLRRYQNMLFANWKMPEVSCFIHMGGCKNHVEALFVKMISSLPVDVLILKPNQDETCVLEDKMLYEITYLESALINRFPAGEVVTNVGTVAFHAERELDGILYQDTGLFRNQQFSKADIIVLQTMYEEIKILWEQELKYRTSFEIINDTVKIPVIYAKISGVKNGDTGQYWKDIKSLVNEDTVLVDKMPFINGMDVNPIKAHATEFLKKGKLQKQKIRESNVYQYSHLRDKTQEYILMKLQTLIDQKLIKGTFETGIEYTIVSTILNLPRGIIQLIQKFDFTKKNGKIIYINTSEENIGLEDTIMTSFLNLIGMDVLFFVPTGYQTVEKYLNKKMMTEHQIGEYMYNLEIPNINTIKTTTLTKWRDKIFKRGR